MAKLLIATYNHGKFVEIEALLEGAGVELVAPDQLGLDLEVEENGQTYAENAAIKALAFCRASGLAALADDSGLEVEALGGEPGIRSARFSPQPGATDADRRVYLLARLLGRTRPWWARFHCTVALAAPERGALKNSAPEPALRFAEGYCPGEIIPEERGENGFGYDPIFLIPEMNRTMAELSLAEKNRLSHRANAIRAALPMIQELAGG